MTELLKNRDVIYNFDYIVCMPQYDAELYENFKYSFKNVFLIKDNIQDTKNITEFIKNNNVRKVIFVDFLLEYNGIIRKIDLDIDVKFILTKSLASITNGDIYYITNSVFDLYKKNVFKDLGVLDINWYDTLKNTGINVKLLKLDIPQKESKKINDDKNYIGILSGEYNANHSFFNSLSAIKLNGKYTPNLFRPADITKDFTNAFDIKCAYSESEDYISENIINLYVNFTDNNNIVFLKSMDLGIPCIMGNTRLLKKYPTLDKYLTLQSDDDINEISDKINLVIENKETILKEYENFRKQYSEESKNSIDEFLEKKEVVINKEEMLVINNEESLLLTIVVPIYNTAQYIPECIESIYNARIKDMEILAINDGSTDNSEEVIMEYVNKYPNLIRYIKQENHGLGNVRNVGLEHAKGKYILSVDSDDSIDINFLKEAEKYLKNDIDMVICDWLSIKEDGEKFETSALDYIFKDVSTYKGLLYTTIMPSTCNKIIKKSLIKSIGYKYAEGLKYEDLSFNPLLMIKAEKIKYINKPYYLYKIRGNSIMRTSAGYNMVDVIKMLDDRINNLYGNDESIEEFKYYTYVWRIEEFVFNQIYDLKNEKEIKEFIDYTESEIGNVINELYFTNRFNIGLEKLKEETKEYILARNKAIKEGRLYSFICESIKDNKYIKITPPMFFYGEK